MRSLVLTCKDACKVYGMDDCMSHVASAALNGAAVSRCVSSAA